MSTNNKLPVGSRTLGVHHPIEARGLVRPGLHRMQLLASFEPLKLRSEGRPARDEGASRKGARPCLQRTSGVVRNPHLSPRHKLYASKYAGVLGRLVRGLCVTWTNFAFTAFYEVGQESCNKYCN
jgi:hypothetical protein